MRHWFFENEQRQIALLAELAGWEGTKFLRSAGQAARKGVAGDCVSAPERVLVHVGAIDPIAWEPYMRRHGLPGEAVQSLERALSKVPNLFRITAENFGNFLNELIVGDLLFCIDPKGFPHLVVFIGNNSVWHMLPRKRPAVTVSNVFDPSLRVREAWRVFDR